MIIRFQGRDWQFSEEDITLKQGVAIHLAWGFTIEEWGRALQHADARAFQCLYWLMLAQNGETTPIKDVDCPIVALSRAFAAAQEAEAAGQEDAAEPDPTSPSGAAPSAEHASRTAMTPQHPGRRAAAGTGS